jgi:hypothetical protein
MIKLMCQRHFHVTNIYNYVFDEEKISHVFNVKLRFQV